MLVLALLMAITFLAACSAMPPRAIAPFDARRFDEALVREAQSYELPGYAALVQAGDRVVFETRLGRADIERGRDVDAGTLFPVASLTKTFAAVVVLQLAEEGRLGLDDAVKRHLPDVALADSVRIRHLLSHTSEGEPGSHFRYNGGRYALLTRIIAQASGASFAQNLDTRIVAPLQLRDTFLLGDDAASTPRRDAFAQPYRYDGGNRPGEVEFGHSASAGIVSTPRDIAAFNAALMSGRLLRPASLRAMRTPPREGLPYGLGVFVQRIAGDEVVWGYGQYDCYASLSVMLPERGWSFVFVANNNTPSDASRLIYGDLRYSPLALAFLAQTRAASGESDALAQALQRARLLRDAFFGEFDAARRRSAVVQARAYIAQHAPERSRADLVMVHALSFMQAAAEQTGEPVPQDFDAWIIAKAGAVLAGDPHNPYAHYYLATLHAARGDPVAARRHYRAIVDAPNAARGWYTGLAQDALKAEPTN
jgi:CubicO group peptidase (beta-lactamase class C family)